MNITLIGMAGSGKSFVGEKLAKHLGYEFISPDRLLEKEHGVLLQQVLEKLGSECFLDAEAEVVISHTKDKDELLISPGGSMIYRTHAMEHLSAVSEIVYLEVPFETIEQRVGKIPRGIVGLDKMTFRELYESRLPHYEKWGKIRGRGDQPPEKVIEDIISKVNVPVLVH